MPIEFEKARVAVDKQFLEKIRETKESAERAVNGLQSGNITDGLEALRLAVQLGKAGLCIGSMLEYLDREDREREVFIEEQDRRVIAALEHAGVDLTGIIEPKDETKEPEAQPKLAEADEAAKGPLRKQSEASEPRSEEREEKKRRGVARIRANMGNLEAFKTGDPEVDKRFLEAPLDSFFGVGGGMTGGFCRKFALDRKPLIHDLLSHSPEEIVPARNWGAKRFEKILEQLYERGIIPDEKWDYAEIVDKFVGDSSLELSPEVRISLMNAALVARKFRFKYIVSEDLFFGLISDELPLQVKDDDKSVRYWVAENYGVDPLIIETKLQDAYTRRTGESQSFDVSQMTFTENLLRVLRKADEIRVRRSSEKISPSDAMEALFSKKAGLLARVLTKLGPRKEIKQPSGYMFRNVTAG